MVEMERAEFLIARPAPPVNGSTNTSAPSVSPASTSPHRPQASSASQADIQAEEDPSPARARLETKAAQVHRELFGNENAGEGNGEREEAGMVPSC